MRIRAFQGLTPKNDLASKVASLPYDVVSTAEARDLAAGNPVSMLHVVRAEIDLPAGTDPYSDAVYAKAVENLRNLEATGTLVREPEPCLYFYRQTMGAHVQTGLVAVCHVDDYESGLIKKHEKTRPAKENDRTRLTSDLAANPGPVFLTYRDDSAVDALAAEITAGAPHFDFEAPDGVRHTGWRVPGGKAIVEAFGGVPCVYVADGHHRAASAARVGRERREANPGHTGDEDYNWFLTVLFPASQLKILDYNRVVTDLQGKSPAAFLEALKAVCPVTENATPSPSAPGQASLYLDGRWYGLTLDADPAADPVSRLDVSILQDRVLAPLLGIDDPRTSERIDFVGGIRGTEFLEQRVNSGEMAAAFAMYPVSVDELMAIADADQIMAPKSTWFEPKLRSGLFIHTF